MSDACAGDLRVVLHGSFGSGPLGAEGRRRVIVALLESGVAVSCNDGSLAPRDVNSEAVLVLGNFGECPPSEMVGHGHGSRLHYDDVSGLDSDGVVTLVHKRRQRLGAPEPGAWLPWFPVIDYDRCTSCKQCLSFCLFGVFGVDDSDRVVVANAAKCKTGCPACSRVCPNTAIMFPKFEGSPVNGAVVDDTGRIREPVKVNLDDLLGGDVNAALRERSRRAGQRFSVEPAGMSSRLDKLKEMQDELGIPDEVLAGLKPMCACQRRAAEQAAAQRNATSGTTEESPAPSKSTQEWDI